MMTNETTAQSSPSPPQGGNGGRAIREKLRKLIEEARAVRLAGGGG